MLAVHKAKSDLYLLHMQCPTHGINGVMKCKVKGITLRSYLQQAILAGAWLGPSGLQSPHSRASSRQRMQRLQSRVCSMPGEDGGVSSVRGWHANVRRQLVCSNLPSWCPGNTLHARQLPVCSHLTSKPK